MILFVVIAPLSAMNYTILTILSAKEGFINYFIHYSFSVLANIRC